MSDPSTSKWYMHRLSAMPVREVLHRVKRKCVEPLVHRAILDERLPTTLAGILSSADTSIGLAPFDPARISVSKPYLAQLIKEADDVCAHNIRLFGRTFNTGDSVNWFRDYAHGVDCPRLEAGKLNYRDPSQVGDIMHLWWLNRHQHLMPAAIAWFVTDNQRYAEEVLRQLESWLENCPYPVGPAWLTGIEAGVRLLTWSWLFRFLFARGRPKGCSDAFLVSWFLSIRQHVHFINTHWAKYSSANNHIIAEAVGVLAASVTWPPLFVDMELKAKCHRILRRETAKQVSPDGVSREQSTSYHAFVLELLLNAALLHEPTKTAIAKRAGRMTNLLHALARNVATPCEFGDADDAVATGIIPRSPVYYQQIAAAARGIFGEKDLKPVAAVSSPVSWYTGKVVDTPPPPASADFSEGGYVIWNCTLPNQLSVKFCMDVGQLGYGTLAAHGHADALSLTMCVNGEPVLIDPGTYAYHDEPLWRDYFKGTRAHNTLRVNNLDQAESLGPFLWGSKYEVDVNHVVMSEDQLDIEAEHDGYYRDNMRLIHRRHISWHPLLKKWIIKDELVGNGSYNVDLFFHVHPDRKVVQDSASVFRIIGTGYEITIQLSTHLTCRIARGETDPPLGWHSPVLGRKVPCSTIVGAGPVIGFDNLFTEFSIACLDHC